VTARSPRLSAELPSISELPDGARFEGLIPPIVKAPTFAIRKPAVAIFTLAEYAEAAIMTAEEAEFLRNAVAGHSNILVAGGTSSGKTTLVNALLAEVAWTADRVILIEDTRELQCKAANFVALRTREDVVSMSDLVRSSLRLRPDRIPVGECAAAPRPSISSRRGGPVIRAGSARSTPRPRSERCTGSNNSSRSSSSPFPGR
jgi:type IV secretion system protein VirB11